MKIINNTTEFYIEEETAVAIGKFDGFHRGHQKLLKIIQEQKEKGLATVVFTFVPSPTAFFSKEVLRDLTTVEEKRRIFETAGVDYLIEYPFYQETADMEPETYIKEVWWTSFMQSASWRVMICLMVREARVMISCSKKRRQSMAMT